MGPHVDMGPWIMGKGKEVDDSWTIFKIVGVTDSLPKTVQGNWGVGEGGRRESRLISFSLTLTLTC